MSLRSRISALAFKFIIFNTSKSIYDYVKVQYSNVHLLKSVHQQHKSWSVHWSTCYFDRDDVKIRNHIEPEEVNKSREVMKAIGGQSRRSSLAPPRFVFVLHSSSYKKQARLYSMSKTKEENVHKLRILVTVIFINAKIC